ncbi:MAG: CYTH domain-containing protein [Halothiobacillaceae bacterium]
MGIEIERKFLVRSDGWRNHVVRSVPMRQGYMTESGPASVRVRVAGDRGYLNIKSMTLGVTRHEYEYEIDVREAGEMLDNLCIGPRIEKIRHIVEDQGHHFEVDVFEGDNAGLVVAELELEHAEQPIRMPDWLGEEVSDDPRYYNVSLVRHPYRDWN